MILIKALTVLDIVSEIDANTRDKSASCSPNLTSFDPMTGIFKFVTSCANSRNAWNQQVRIVDWDVIVPEEIRETATTWDNVLEEIPDVMYADAVVNCDCPAFVYWGYAYISDQLDIGENAPRYDGGFPEGRAPDIRNPALEGVVCKHLAAVLQMFF